MRRTGIAVTAIATATATITLTISTAGAAGAAPPPPPGADAAKRNLAGLTVRAEGSDSGYDRKKFPHWIERGGNCNTREAVLKRDGENVRTGSDCYPTSGTWTSPYDGATWTKASDLDIDHMVALAEAWRSGASSWTTSRRQAFANDMGSSQLWTVTDNVNQAKGDKDPAEWTPPRAAFHCMYARSWIDVKHRYGLTVDPAEKSALGRLLGRC
ncbi:HNH endonuclease [Actinomadura sp. KC216]|uniref:HNH endonuclease family protein n=1 Tax=Actinomadura sp. KC216 TaxID=2530370 RepID=UPI00104B1348|nr:HNH endonuclease family protein [Actinomadura sp. KC216]TDB84954.1 HNH endonuclease [Actinomadura sp. KC216]